MTDAPPLDRWRLDQALNPPARIIWGADAIAARIGTSADFVRDTLAKMQGTPIRRMGRRYCADEGELMAFFREDPTQTQNNPDKPICGDDPAA